MRIEAQLTCATVGDAGAIEAKVDALEAALVAAIRPVPASECLQRKFQSVAERANRKLTCHERAADDGDPVDPGCLADADTEFTSDWANAENPGDCLTLGDEASLAAIADDFVDDIVALLRPVMTASECSSRKLSDTAVSANRIVRNCHGGALGNGLPVNPECIANNNDRVVLRFANAEMRFGAECLTTGDSGAVNTRTLTFASDVEMALVP
jgi:hypothetical protein